MAFHLLQVPDETGKRSRAIDLLRGVAILLVLGCHYAVPPDRAGPLTPLAELGYRFGWCGVDLFFVLSGYLVSGLWFAEYRRSGRVDARRFLLRRGLKILPAYAVYLGFLAVWLAFKRGQGEGEPVWSALWPNLLQVQNYFHTPRLHTWSLAVEEHFYLAGALGAAALLTPLRFGTAARLGDAFCVMLLLGVALTRFLTWTPDESEESLTHYATHLRFDGLLIGSWLAAMTHFAPQRLSWCKRHPIVCLVVGIAFAAPTLAVPPSESPWTAGAGLTFMYAGFAVVVLGLVNLEQQPSWRGVFASAPSRWLAWIGFFSYGIYLWHADLARAPMKRLATRLHEGSWPDWAVWLLANGGEVLLAIVFGALMSRLIELPVLAYRDRILPRSPANAPTPVSGLSEPSR